MQVRSSISPNELALREQEPVTLADSRSGSRRRLTPKLSLWLPCCAGRRPRVRARCFQKKSWGCRLTPLSVLLGGARTHEQPPHGSTAAKRACHRRYPYPAADAGRAKADLLDGRFNPSAPQPHQLCAPGDAFPAIYFWLFAGGDGRSRRAILRTCLAWRNGAYAGVRGYARAASP